MPKVILGIDPGYATVGYGAVEYDGSRFKLLGYGAITTQPGKKFTERLAEIYRDLLTLIDHFEPDAIAIEELFFSTNVKTGIAVGHARGVTLLACFHKGIEPAEYTPLQVKQSVVGYGKAEKKQVMEMTRLILGLDKVPRPDDAADALAIAICHAHSMAAGIHSERKGV